MNKLKDEMYKEREQNKVLIVSFLNNLLVDVCGKDCLKVDIRFDDIYDPEYLIDFETYILNEQGKETFASQLSVRYGVDRYFSRNKDKELRLTQCSCGLISKKENLGKYYADILKGQIWLNEDKLIELLNSLDWSNWLKYKELEHREDFNSEVSNND